MNNLRVTASNRYCVLVPRVRLTAAAARRDLLAGRRVESGFQVITAPAPAYDETAFQVSGHDREVLVAVALFDSLKRPPAGGPDGADTTVELFFDLRRDRLGYVQFILSPGRAPAIEPGKPNPHRDRAPADEVTRLEFEPGPDSASSARHGLAIKRYETREEVVAGYAISPLRVRWVFVWLTARDVFRHGDRVGFNVARHRPAAGQEYSAWNFLSGNGGPDATAYGTLYRRPPAGVFSVARACAGAAGFELVGRVARPAADGCVRFRLVDPGGGEQAFRARVKNGEWQARVPVAGRCPGRYRLYRTDGPGHAEPDFVALDWDRPAAGRSFPVSLLFDTPMCVIANAYTPARLRDQMRLIADLGFSRIHWLDYGNWPSFWFSPGMPWAAGARATFRACPALTRAATAAAHAVGLDVIGNLKVFDLGMNCFFVEPRGRAWGAAAEMENRHSSVIPEIAAHPEWTMQANPAWLRETAFPVTRLRFYSLDPIRPAAGSGKPHLYTSADNRTWRLYRGPVSVRQGRVRRPHRAWTPAGLRPAAGVAWNHFLEFDGLKIAQPFAAVVWSGGPARLRQRGFMAADARGADGKEAALTMATNGDRVGGFFFWKGWQGWNNVDEALVQERVWSAPEWGVAFREADRMPTLLEPAFAGARDIWLDRVRGILDAGADGVSIRTYCHHNGPMHYLKYAYAGPVREAFERENGRAPEPNAADAARVRRIRAGFFTQFMRAASVLTRGRGGTFWAELESGIEIPDTCNSRMQLPLEWERWLAEGLLDGVRLKYFTADNPFVHERVMPAARRAGVPVELISRCLHDGVGARAVEMADLLATRARAAGFSGYCLYEQQNLMDMNALGVTNLKGPVRPFMAAFKRALGSGGR